MANGAEINADGVYCIKPQVWERVEEGGWWEPRPTPRYYHRTECTDGALYSIAGRGTHEDGADMIFREVWKFDFLARRWTKLQVQGLPEDFAVCCATLLLGSVLFLSAASDEGGFDMGEHDAPEEMFVAQLPEGTDRKIEFRKVARCPFELLYNDTLVLHGESLFKVERAASNALYLDVYAFRMWTNEWSLISDGVTSDGPQARERHRTVCHRDRIYVFGGKVVGGLRGSCTLEELPVFNLTLSRWQLLRTVADAHCHEKFPPGREDFECVQVPSQPSTVYIIGGWMEVSAGNFQPHGDCWRINLDTLQWQRINSLSFPFGLFHHSASITPDGRMCVFAGLNDGDATADLFVSWAVVPKLADACFEAVLSYIRDGTITLPRNVRELGLPKKYAERLQSSALTAARLAI